VCFMGVSGSGAAEIYREHFQHFAFHRRNVRDPFAWRMDWSRVSAFLDPTSRKPNHVNCAAKSPAKIIHARAHSIGTKRLMMFPTCSPNPERLATTTSDTVTCSRNVAKSIHPDRWLRLESSCFQRRALLHSKNGSLAIGMQLV
jgi:hypothetical protein